MTPAAAALLLFPSQDFHEVGLGAYGADSAAEYLPLSQTAFGPAGIDLRYERLYGSMRADSSPTGEGARVRLYRTETGEMKLDELAVDSLLVTVRSRPQLGQYFDLGLFLGTWDEVWVHRDNGRAQWRVYTPINITLLGLSVTDQDPQEKLKYYFSGGIGGGGEWLGRLVGPLGLQLQAEADLKSSSRWRSGEPNAVRHELIVEGELGLSWLEDNSAWTLGLWTQRLTWWDPNDESGRDGVDTQYQALGVDLSARFFRKKAPPDQLDLEARLQDFRDELTRVQEQAADEGTEEPVDPADAAPPEDGASGSEAEAQPDPPPWLPVHFSETRLRIRVDPVGVAGTTCSVRFRVGADGVPVDIQPEACPEALRPDAMVAAWQWRLEPFLVDDEAVPVEFVQPLSFVAAGAEESP